MQALVVGQGRVCVYYYRTYYKAVRGGEGGWRVEDMCYERLQAKTSVN